MPLWKAMQAFKSAILAIIGKSQVLIQVDNLRRLPRLGYAIGPIWDLLAKPCLMVEVRKWGWIKVIYSKLWNQVPSSSLFTWMVLTLKKLRQVGCYDVEKFRLITIDSCALIDSCLLFTNLDFATSQHPTCLNIQQRKLPEFQIPNWPEEGTWFHSFEKIWCNLQNSSRAWNCKGTTICKLIK